MGQDTARPGSAGKGGAESASGQDQLTKQMAALACLCVGLMVGHVVVTRQTGGPVGTRPAVAGVALPAGAVLSNGVSAESGGIAMAAATIGYRSGVGLMARGALLMGGPTVADRRLFVAMAIVTARPPIPW
jgi:hypothetical protein